MLVFLNMILSRMWPAWLPGIFLLAGPVGLTGQAPVTGPAGCGQIILSGGGDICEGNCPEMPNVISFEVIGSDLPFTVDLLVSSTGFPQFPINGLPVTNGETIQICLEGILPSFDPATNTLTIPIFAIGLTAMVQVVNAVTNSGCPVTVEPNSLTIHFIEAASVSTGNDQVICAGQSVDVSATPGGSAVTVAWSSTGDGSFDDPSATQANYSPGPGDIQAGTVTLVVTAFDENMACIPAMATLEVTIEPSISVEVATPVTICDNAVADVIAMVTGPSVDMEWTSDGDGDFEDPSASSTVYMPGPGDMSAGTVILTYAPTDPGQCIGDIEPVELFLVPAPTVSAPINLEVCNDDSLDVFISIQGDYGQVTWATDGDGILTVYNDEEINYEPGPQDVDNQFVLITVTVVSLYPECGQSTYAIPVDLIDCSCPPLEVVPSVMPLCATSDSLGLVSLLVQGGSGTWTVSGTPGGPMPATIQGSWFVTLDSDPGLYQLTYTLSFPEPGCPSSATVDVPVENAAAYQPDLGPDRTICEWQPVQVTVNFPSGPPSGHVWSSSGDGTWVPDPANPASMATYWPGASDSTGTQVSLVYTSQSGICEPVNDTLHITVVFPPVVMFSTDTISICNATGMGSVLDLFAWLAGGDTSGTWSNPAGIPVDLSRPDSVDFDGVVEGYYFLSYTTGSATLPCMEVTGDVVIHVQTCNCPTLAIQDPPAGVCQDLAQLPLNPFIISGAPGSWSIIQRPPGTDPATLSGDVLVLDTCDPGLYRLRFTLDGAPLAGCPDSAEMDLFVQEIPRVAVAGDTAGCGRNPIAVSTAFSGSATGITWMSDGLGVFQDPANPTTNYTPADPDLVSAQIRIWARSIDTFGFCSPAADTLEVLLFTPPFTRFSQLTNSLCTDADSNHVVNLAAWIVGGDGTGTWSDPSGQLDLTDPTQVDFTGLPAWTYVLQYTTATAQAPCMDSVYSFSIDLRACADCPPLDIDSAPLQACTNDTLDLGGRILDAAPGAWSVIMGPAGGNWPQVAGNQLELPGVTAGSYLIEFRLADSVPDCPASVRIMLQVDSGPVWNILSDDCHPSKLYYTVRIATDALSILPDTGSLSTVLPGVYAIDSIPAGTDLDVILLAANGCRSSAFVAAPDCDCTLMLEDIADTITFCPGDTFVLIPLVTGAQGLPFATWVTPYGTFMRPTLPLYRPGNYIWIVRDMAGCEERDSFYANFLGPASIIVDLEGPSCPGRTDGAILLQDLPGGEAPFNVIVDGGVPTFVGSLPVRFEGLGSGVHTISVLDATGCQLDSMYSLMAAAPGTLDLGPDRTIAPGDSLLVVPEWFGIEPVQWSWTPTLGSPDGNPFWISPLVDMVLVATITDSAGCQARDTLLIRVVETARVAVPNVFSPNGDGVNDVFEISVNSADVRIRIFEIYDRWGGLLYAAYDQAGPSWNGQGAGKQANPGVYVYRVVYEDGEGGRFSLQGDITLLR